MSVVHLSNSGFLVDSQEINNVMQANNLFPQKFNKGFISAAKSSMIGDTPDIDDITDDIYKHNIISGKTMIKFTDYIINYSLSLNKKRIETYFKSKGVLPDNFKINLSDFHLTLAKKMGAYVKGDDIGNVVLLTLNETHWQELSRDYIGYYFEIIFKGKIEFIYSKKLLEKASITYTKIPFLFFKSANALSSSEAQSKSSEILTKIVKRSIEPMFV